VTEAIIPTGIAFIGSLIENFIAGERLRLSERMHFHWLRVRAFAGIFISVTCKPFAVRFDREAGIFIRAGDSRSVATGITSQRQTIQPYKKEPKSCAFLDYLQTGSTA